MLRTPRSHQPLRLQITDGDAQEIHQGWLVTVDGAHRYPIRDGVPRFAPEFNYADNFGMQWNHFSRTQLDSHSGQPISARRFWAATGWRSDDMRDQWVLDAGRGSGRFAEVALSSGAQIIALDYSTAADAAFRNLRGHRNIHVIQGTFTRSRSRPGRARSCTRLESSSIRPTSLEPSQPCRRC